MTEAEPLIARVLRQRHKLADQKRDDFEIQNLVQILQTRAKVYREFTLLVSTLAGISLLVGGIGVMNVMLVAVAERTTKLESGSLSAPVQAIFESSFFWRRRFSAPLAGC
jgi:putative ABC transport system permease protein